MQCIWCLPDLHISDTLALTTEPSEATMNSTFYITETLALTTEPLRDGSVVKASVSIIRNVYLQLEELMFETITTSSVETDKVRLKL